MLESAGSLYGEDNHEGLLQELGDDVELSNVCSLYGDDLFLIDFQA